MKLHPLYPAICLAWSGAAQAATPSTTEPPPAQTAPSTQAAQGKVDEARVTKVEINGKGEAYDPRRDDTASKTVITSAEIMKYGDTNVFDVLKRAPGVTVIGNTVRMRGLGAGYTQVLVNGEAPPPGFSMDALTPDQIERVEVIRSATAEMSTRAIAGTVNIVLKKVVSKAQRDVRINTAYSNEHKGAMAIATLADRKGNLSYYLNAAFRRNLNKGTSTSTDRFSLEDGAVVQLRDNITRFNSNGTMAGIQPRLNWKLDNDGQFNLSAFIQTIRGDHGSDGLRSNRIGSFGHPDYAISQNRGTSDAHFAGGDVNWVTKLGGGKLDAKMYLSSGLEKNGNQSLSSTADRSVALLRDRYQQTRYKNATTSGKFTRSLFDGHALATGWEGAIHTTDEDVHRVEGLAHSQRQDIFENFTPVVRRLAVYAQDEWNVTPVWSMYLGARWETIRTQSEGTGLATTRSRSSVLTPVAQTLYKFPDKSGRQLRMALTRTFKMPMTYQLSARRSEADLNTQFTPDRSGNPDLRPELATGIDLTYEQFWSQGAVFSIGTSMRRIEDTIRDKLTQDARGYWLIRPVNEGSAQVRTLDLELKFPLKAVMKDAPEFDFRLNVNRNWSDVDGIPGPNNRLDQQVPLSATLGVDYKGKGAFSAGASFAYRGGGMVQVSQEQSRQMFARRELEAYALYKFGPRMQLRVALNNALDEDNLGYARYRDASGISESWSRNPDSRRLQANLEIKF